MRQATAYTASVIGIKPILVLVTARVEGSEQVAGDSDSADPTITVSGHPATVPLPPLLIRHVQRALRASGFRLTGRVEIELTLPMTLPRSNQTGLPDRGAWWLAIALAILSASRQLSADAVEALERSLVVGSMVMDSRAPTT